MQNWNSLSKKIATRIEDMIATSEDARLPSQRELSSLFKVSRTTVREALSLLEASGKLRTEPGRRSFWVGSPHAASQLEHSYIARHTRANWRSFIEENISEIGDFALSLSDRRSIRADWRRCELPTASCSNLKKT